MDKSLRFTDRHASWPSCRVSFYGTVCQKKAISSSVSGISAMNLRAMLYIALPVIVGSAADQINVLVDRTLASGIALGGISALNYAYRLSNFVHGLFVISLSSVMYPTIASMASKRDIKGLKAAVSEVISTVNLMVVPISIGASVFSEPIVDLPLVVERLRLRQSG